MNKEELKEFLKDNLRIDVTFYKSTEIYNDYTNVKVKILLDDELISESEDWITNR